MFCPIFTTTVTPRQFLTVQDSFRPRMWGVTPFPWAFWTLEKLLFQAAAARSFPGPRVVSTHGYWEQSGLCSGGGTRIPSPPSQNFPAGVPEVCRGEIRPPLPTSPAIWGRESTVLSTPATDPAATLRKRHLPQALFGRPGHTTPRECPPSQTALCGFRCKRL